MVSLRELRSPLLQPGVSSGTGYTSILSPRMKFLWNATVVILMLFTISIGVLLYRESDSHSKYRSCRQKLHCGLEQDYVVLTKGCRIFNFAPFEFVHRDFFKSESDILLPSCDPKNKGELVKATRRFLYVDSSYERNYTKQSIDKIVCCYQPFDRVVTPEENSSRYFEDVEGNIMFSKNCYRFKNPVLIKHQFVYVKCLNSSQELVYEDYFTFAVDRKDIDEASLEEPNPSDPNDSEILDEITLPQVRSSMKFSVLILGFDSMSRLNFLRQMPATASFFEENGGVSLLGYNKVGYNTFPNLIPVLTGMNVSRLKKTCWPTRTTVLDKCPFIWKLFRQQGYFTAYAEDNTFTSTFSYRKKGFRSQPVDYYLKPYYMMASSQLKVVALNPPTAVQCLGLRKNLDRFVEVIKGFASNMKRKPTFGLFWFNGMSHDYLNLDRDDDLAFWSMLDSLQDEGALENTVVIALSDHGIRWGKFRETFQGFSEERLPLATILLPETFKASFPKASRNLLVNAKRLTVPYDLHETLLDILNVSRLPDLDDNEETPLQDARGLSLFRPIPQERTCLDAGVPAEFCACSELRVVEDAKLQVRLGSQAVAAINDILQPLFNVCSHLSLAEVNSVFEQTLTLKRDLHPENREFFVRFKTTPGNGSFEALMQIMSDEIITPLGVISRINMYKNDSYCVDDEILKLYCFCKADNSDEPVARSVKTTPITDSIIQLEEEPEIKSEESPRVPPTKNVTIYMEGY